MGSSIVTMWARRVSLMCLRMAPHVVEALGGGLVEHDREDAVLTGQRADGLPLLVGDAVDDELGETAVVVGDAERGVPGADEVAGGADDGLEHLVDRAVPAHGQHRGAHRPDPVPFPAVARQVISTAEDRVGASRGIAVTRAGLPRDRF